MTITINYSLASDAALSAELARHEREDHVPCNSLTTQTIALKNAVMSVLIEALKADGWTIRNQDANSLDSKKGYERLTWAAGVGLGVTTDMGATRVQAITGGVTQAYSRAAVSWAAQRAGWQVQKTGANTMTLSRR